MTPDRARSDSAQVRVFRDLVGRRDREVLTARIVSAGGHAGHAQNRELGEGLRALLAVAHQLVGGLIARDPELRGIRRPSGR